MDEDNNHGEWKLVQGGRGKGPKTEDRQPNAYAAEVESSPSTQEPVLVRFKIITGDFRTEPEVLAMLHVEHPAVKIKIKNTHTRSSILISRDEMTINLLESLDNIRGKKVSFNRMEPAGESRTYVLMGVPLCVPENLPQADPAVISATRMTRWCKQSKSAQPTEMVKVQLAGKEHPPRFTRGYGSYKMRTFNPGPLQCFNCQKYGHLVVSCIREVPTCRYCAGLHTSKDCKGKTDITLKCSNYNGPHATSRGAANDFHELSFKKERSRVQGPDCCPDKASYGSTQEASKEDRRDICTSSTGLSRQYQCCRDPQTQTIRSEHPIYATQETSGIGLSTAAEGSSTTGGRTVQTLYMVKTEDTGQTARGRGTGTSYNHSGTSGSLESVGRHQTRESSADSSFDQDDRGSSRCNQTTDVMHNDRHDLRIVSWNAQGAKMETARIQDAVQQDSIDVLMLQDTRYTKRQDGLPPLRL